MDKQAPKKILSKKQLRKKKIKRNRIIFAIILLLLIGIGTFAFWFINKTNENGGGLSGALAATMGHNQETLKNLDKINVLVLGESGIGDGYKLADSIMIASYDPKNQKASLMSIPRDTYVGKTAKNKATTNYLASYKMNSVYRNGANIPQAIECINGVTGLDLKYYVIIDTATLKQLVDAIGGVQFNVPIDMDYEDFTQELYIHLKAGEQLIDGAKAEQLLRFRHNTDGTSYPYSYGDQDIGRMRTQREFIMATVKQTAKPENIFKAKQILDIIFGNIKTNIGIDTIKDYIPYAVNFNTENLKTGVLPGKSELVNKVWIYSHDVDETKKMVDELFRDIVEPMPETETEASASSKPSAK